MASNAPEAVELESPGLAKLVRQMERNPNSLAAFWDEVEATGAPLFEEFDPETRTWLVTFVYRETEPLENVLLNEWIHNLDFPDKVMTHLDGTDIWYKSLRIVEGLRTQYCFAPNDSLVPKRDETDWEPRRAKWVPDPLNKTPLVRPESTDIERLRGQRDSVLELPGAPDQPWIRIHEGIERGEITHHRFASDILGNERDIWLYVHPTVDRDQPAPLLVQFDGELFDEVLRTPTVLDNLTAAGEIAPMAAVFIGNVDRGEELPCNPEFVSMMTRELLPFVTEKLEIEIVPETTVANGVSYGGLAAMFAGLTAPESFGMVASQSGSFWWKPNPMSTSDIVGATDEFSWLPEQAAIWPRVDVCIWMEAGTLEGRGFMNVAPSLLDSNRHMRNVLRARGYEVEYQEYVGGHDFAHWRNSLGDALIHLLGQK